MNNLLRFNSSVSEEQKEHLLSEWMENVTEDWDLSRKKILLIIPDHTRTAPIGMMFKLFCSKYLHISEALDIMVALGTHPRMSEEAICKRLEITPAELHSTYSKVRLFNHRWDDPDALCKIGEIQASEIKELTKGLFEQNVEVTINRRIFDYDRIIILGPVYPHEVVGFSGGNKYFFPGISGAGVTNFFHWLGAVVTNVEIIGKANTVVRAVVDKAASLISLNKKCFCMVTDHQGKLAAVSAGTPEEAWKLAWPITEELHICFKSNPFHTILSCAPEMYDELWVAGKCMYKLEPVLAEGGELIIYAPHLTKISDTHGRLIEEIGYHCRDYFLAQWELFKNKPWGVLAHSTHIKGQGTFKNGKEYPRANVVLATGIPEDVCKKINLGYRDPATIYPSDFANCEDEGVLLVPKAGEMLFRLH